MLLARQGFRALLVDRATAPDYHVRPVAACCYYWCFSGVAQTTSNSTYATAAPSGRTGAIPLPDFMSNENLGRIMAAAKDVEPHGRTTFERSASCT
jgi:hypothetical protein